MQRSRGWRLVAIACMGAVVMLNIFCTLLSMPAVLTATTPDGTMIARASSPGILPRFLARGSLRFRLEIRDNRTGEVVTPIDQEEHSDFEHWLTPSELAWSGTDGILTCGYRMDGIGSEWTERLLIRRHPLRYQALSFQ
jgi:WD40 repeat protein